VPRQSTAFSPPNGGGWLEVKGPTDTKPGTLLEQQIPVRTWVEWDDATHYGLLEIDLVSHDGSTARGEFAWILDWVDILTGWTETVALPNKARKWVIEALDTQLSCFPFPIRRIDSDNGSNFINHHLLTWCENHPITLTPARAYYKNDDCYVEQKTDRSYGVSSAAYAIKEPNRCNG
jgi:hypothetical protein